MKYFLLILVFFLSLISYSQNELTIVYEDLKIKKSDPNLKSYYPKLLKRYIDFDASLTLEEKALIYYGFSFQEDYMKKLPNEERLNSLVDINDYENIVLECQKILDLNPVSLKANNQMGYALYKLGRSESEWKKYQNRYRDFRKIIAYSGDGLSCETAFKVIYVIDEYNMIYDYFEIKETSKQSLEQLCDKFDIQPSEYFKSQIIYFNASRSLLRKQEILNGE